MIQPLKLATMAGLVIAGAVTGVQLGKGAVAEINPVYFSAPAPPRFFADLAPGGYRPAALVWARPAEADANNVNVSGRAECFDCRNFVEDAAPTEQAIPFAGSEMSFATSEEPNQARPMPDEVARYASFAVTVEEARIQEAASRAAYPKSAAASPELQQIEASPIGM